MLTYKAHFINDFKRYIKSVSLSSERKSHHLKETVLIIEFVIPVSSRDDVLCLLIVGHIFTHWPLS